MRHILYPQKLALTSSISGGRSVGIVRSRAQATVLVSVSITFPSDASVRIFFRIFISRNVAISSLFPYLFGLVVEDPAFILSQKAATFCFLSSQKFLAGVDASLRQFGVRPSKNPPCGHFVDLKHITWFHLNAIMFPNGAFVLRNSQPCYDSRLCPVEWYP
jgi:hypothetical protein